MTTQTTPAADRSTDPYVTEAAHRWFCGMAAADLRGVSQSAVWYEAMYARLGFASLHAPTPRTAELLRLLADTARHRAETAIDAIRR